MVTRMLLALVLLPLATELPADEPREPACEARHRDYGASGHLGPDYRDIARAYVVRDRTLTLDAASSKFGDPVSKLVVGKFTRAMWLSESQRRSKRIDCEGPETESVWWNFVFVEIEWEGAAPTGCVVYGKSIPSVQRPDPFTATSPFDRKQDCDDPNVIGGD